jgi:MerR family transcriptional regulator, light-induced transcriptional regulator
VHSCYRVYAGEQPLSESIGVGCRANLNIRRLVWSALEIVVGEDAVDAPLYNTAAVVQRTGVPAATIRAWERRYAFPKPHRDASGQRLYSERDIQAIRWLQSQTEQSVSISRAVAMLRQGYAQPAALSPDQGPRSFESLRQDLRATLLAFDAAGAEAVLTEAFSLFGVEDVCLRVLEPVLVDIGEGWHAGELSVGQEHFASALIRARLSALLLAYAPTDGMPSILTAAAPGERHELGILMVSLFLARHGYRVHYLGQDLPLEEVRDLAGRLKPVLIVLSAHGTDSALRLRDVRRVLDGLPPAGPRFAYGGRAFNEQPELRASMPGTFTGRDARAAGVTAGRLPGGRGGS